MPLHLLSKKSWNVYSPANRARVARDEALAEAAQRDAQRLQRDQASSSTLDELREGPHEKQAIENKASQLSAKDQLILKATKNLTTGSRDDRKRKRLPGEDDTDRDIRYAAERELQRTEGSITKPNKTSKNKQEAFDAPIIDGQGHFNLFPENKSKDKHSRRSELQKQKDEQRASEEAQGMPLKDALGFKDPKGTWYMEKDGSVKDNSGRDVWGNEDPRRKQRDAQRVASSDPLTFMKQAQSQLKEAKRARAERDRELNLRRQDSDDLDHFSLDAGSGSISYPHGSNKRFDERTHRKHREKRRDGHRSRSRERHKSFRRERDPRDNSSYDRRRS